MTPTPDDASRKLKLTKKLAVDEFRAWGLWVWLRGAAPNEYDRLNVEMQKKGVGPRSIENPGFVTALLDLLPSLERRYDEENPKTTGEESVACAVPIDVLSAAQSVIGDENEFRDGLLRSFPGRLVAAYIKKLKENQATASLVDDSQKEARLALALEKTIGAAAATVSSDRLSPEEAVGRLVSLAGPLVLENGIAQGMLLSMLESQRYLNEVALLADSGKLFHSFQESATTMPIARMDIATELLRDEIVGNPTAPVSASVERALSQARALELFGAKSIEDIANTPGAKTAMSSFFQALAESRTERVIAPIVDALLSFLPVQTQANIIRLVVARSFEKTAAASAELSFLRASAHEHVSRLLSASLLYQSVGGRFLVDRLTAAFGGPKTVLAAALEGLAAHRGDFGRYFGPPLGPGGKLAQTHRGAYHDAAGSWVEAVSLFWTGSHDGVMFIVGRAFPRLLSSGWLRGEGMELLFHWGSGRLMQTAARGAAGLAIRRVLGASVGALLGGPVWLVAALFGPEILGELKNRSLGLLRGALSLIGLGGVGAKGFDSPVVLATAAVVIVIAVAFVGVFLTTATIGGAFSTTYEGRGGGPAETIIPYSGPTPPDAKIKLCPVSGGTITRDPGEESHAGLDAYDIAVPEGTPVVATHDGYVVSYRAEIPKNQYISRNFGNYVRVAGTGYYTTYAHLWDVSGEVVRAAENKTLVAAGTVIGRVDATGWTFSASRSGPGVHLHYQYNNSSGSTGRLVLPPGCAGTK